MKLVEYIKLWPFFVNFCIQSKDSESKGLEGNRTSKFQSKGDNLKKSQGGHHEINVLLFI